MGTDLSGERTLARHPKEADLNDSLLAWGQLRTIGDTIPDTKSDTSPCDCLGLKSESHR